MDDRPALATITAVQARPEYRAGTGALRIARSALYAPVDKKNFVGVRNVFAQRASIYVPVVRDAPRWLQIHVSASRVDVPDGPIDVSVNGVHHDTIQSTPGLPVQQVALLTAAWKYAANVVTLEVQAPGPSRGTDDALLTLDVFRFVYED